MRKLHVAMVIGGALLASASVAEGQRGKVPKGQMPSAGMCRIWIDGVPPGRQPAQTDCATARANAPANSRILTGLNTGNVSGTYDPRYPNRTGGTYDPRYPNRTGGVYDPRYPNGNGGT